MLDDLKVIHERDAQDALGVVEKQWQQYLHNFGFSWQPPKEIYDVVIAGMGGSGLAAQVLTVWPGLHVPITIVQDYELPAHVSENTLLICSSYSGNTEEVVNILNQAVIDQKDAEQKPMVVVLTAGGTLLSEAARLSLPVVQIPSGLQPRMTLGYQFRALIEILEQTSLLDGATAIVETAANWLKDQTGNFLPTVPTDKNPAKQLAQECMGKSVVIYASPWLYPAAYKWKISFNENAKNIAWCNHYSEFNHNEFLGWSSHPIDKPYTVIDLRSNLDDPRIQKRFEISDRLLSGKRPAAHPVAVQGETKLQQLLWAITFGDFVSVYLGLLNGLNPTPVDLIEKLKEQLHG